jgi:small subunit ribosomal protein S8
MQTDPLADFLTQIRNASSASKPECLTPYSRVKSDVANVLKKEGYIQECELTKDGARQSIKVTLKGPTAGVKPIRGIRRISKPGLRRYVGAGEIPKVLGGLGTAVLSTPNGILAGHEAKKQNVGGEILLYIW